MKLPSIPSYEHRKNEIVQKYPALIDAINKLENKIIEYPTNGIKEVILFENRHVVTRKQGMRTNLFSDRLPDHYLYLTINYGMIITGDVALLTIYLHDYVI